MEIISSDPGYQPLFMNCTKNDLGIFYVRIYIEQLEQKSKNEVNVADIFILQYTLRAITTLLHTTRTLDVLAWLLSLTVRYLRSQNLFDNIFDEIVTGRHLFSVNQ